MHTSLRNRKALDNFLCLRKYGLKWFNSSPVTLTSIREAARESEVQRERSGASSDLVITRWSKKAAVSRMKDLRLEGHKTRESIKFPSSEGMP